MVMNNVSPPLLLVMCSGTQSNTFGVGVPEANTKEVFGVINNWINDGAQVVFIGDLNIAAGNSMCQHVEKSSMNKLEPTTYSL